MLKVGQLARRFGLSRSTLLYYDSIGLLKPSGRSPAGYRLYSEKDVERMTAIEIYRQAGLPLADIARLLRGGKDELGTALDARLKALDREIAALRRQQQLIVRLLRERTSRGAKHRLDKERWIEILRATGLDDDDLHRWHVEFERLSPDAHRDFLQSLGMDDEAIERVRKASREPRR